MYPSDIRYTFGNLNVFFDSPTKYSVYDAPQSVSGAADAGEWGEDVYYSVIRYKKEKVTRALLGDSHVRSVVIATEKILHGLQRLRHVISFSPPKSVSIEETLNDFHYNENWNEIKHNVRIEQFVEGACTSVTQTELQNRVLNALRQPVLNDKNVVVTSTSVIDNINKIVSDGTYTDCEQIPDLQKIIDTNISSKDSALSALNSYYTTKTKSK